MASRLENSVERPDQEVEASHPPPHKMGDIQRDKRSIRQIRGRCFLFNSHEEADRWWEDVVLKDAR